MSVLYFQAYTWMGSKSPRACSPRAKISLWFAWDSKTKNCSFEEFLRLSKASGESSKFLSKGYFSDQTCILWSCCLNRICTASSTL
jgi:hypothetical protein